MPEQRHGTGRAKIALLSTISMSAAFIERAAAQENVVNACSGVSLPRSAITETIEPVITGIVAPVEDRVNSILGIVEIIPIVGATFPDLSIDTTSLLSDATSGDQITLQVLNTSGAVVGPSDRCDIVASSYAIESEAGIAIGGNRITGLGEEGSVAVSGEINSIAFGNGASTTAGATRSIAFGTDSAVTATNSVALGADSIASRGAQVGYTAAGLTGVYSSVGEVSFGSAGNLRQLTNIAPGSDLNDAVNVSQLLAVEQQVIFNTSAINSLNTRVVNLEASSGGGGGGSGGSGGSTSPARYADASSPTIPNGGTPTDTVTLAGSSGGPVTFTNVADGEVSEGSNEAVNGGQLYETNIAVANAVQTANNAMTVNSLSVSYDSTTRDTITLNPGGTPTRIRNVARGVDPTDAVNLEQLSEGLASARLYTDQRLLEFDRDLRRGSYAGTATALAAANLPQANESGKSLIALGVGHYGGQNGVAFGFSHAFDNGEIVFKMSGTYDSQGKFGTAAGVGWQF